MELIKQKVIHKLLQTNSQYRLYQNFKAIIRKARLRCFCYYQRNPKLACSLISSYLSVIDTSFKVIFPKKKGMALIAMGGYGRGELYPYSDFDIMILCYCLSEPNKRSIEHFIQTIAHSEIKVGHSVRTIDQLQTDLGHDHQFLTSYLESRFIAGDEHVYAKAQCQFTTNPPLALNEFVHLKYQEQQKKDQKYNSTLEPHIKNSPGTLRYIHILLWIIKYHTLNTTYRSDLQTFSDLNIIPRDETDQLIKIYRKLNGIRFGLHVLAGRSEERLLWSYQQQLAYLQNLQAENTNQLIQTFMQQFYRMSQHLLLLNKICLTAFTEKLALTTPRSVINFADNLAGEKNNLLDIHQHKHLLKPQHLLKPFIHLARNNALTGLTANSVRFLIQTIQAQTPESLRTNTTINNDFLRLFKLANNLSTHLNVLRIIGFLDKYLPHFKNINGLMQFDMYHLHSVDYHIITVVYHVEMIATGKFDIDGAFLKSIFDQLNQPYLLYLAALFHDIGKGSKYPHSQYGTELAHDFCKQLNLGTQQRHLVSWLVTHHLTLSRFTKTKDIADPEIVQQFCSIVQNQQKLDYLTLLTAADLKGTNPQLWSDWSASMVRILYHSTLYQLNNPAYHTSLSHSLINPEQIKHSALKRSHLSVEKQQKVMHAWQSWPDNYFLNNSITNIIWHLSNIIDHLWPSRVYVFGRFNPRFRHCQITIFAPVQKYIFANLTNHVCQMNLSIREARLYTTEDEFTLSEYVICDQKGHSIKDEHQINHIASNLNNRLQTILTGEKLPCYTQSIRKKHHFPEKTIIQIDPVNNRSYSLITVKTKDRHGLLATIARILAYHKLRVRFAKINTLADRTEDYFHVSNDKLKPINEASLRQRLIQELYDALG